MKNLSYDECVLEGGEIRTESLSPSSYRKVCTISGTTYFGEEIQKLTAKERSRAKANNKRSRAKSLKR